MRRRLRPHGRFQLTITTHIIINEIFKSKRAGQFDPKLFETMGTNIDEVIKKYEKGLDEITNKKLILKNNTNF